PARRGRWIERTPQSRVTVEPCLACDCSVLSIHPPAERPASTRHLRDPCVLRVENFSERRSVQTRCYLAAVDVVFRFSGGAADGDSPTPRIEASVGAICVMRITPMLPRART